MTKLLKRIKNKYVKPLILLGDGTNTISNLAMLSKALTNVFRLHIKHQESLAEYIDIFCEEGYFSVEDTKRLLACK